MSPDDDGLGYVFAAAFVGLLFVALALALNAFVLPPRDFAP